MLLRSLSVLAVVGLGLAAFSTTWVSNAATETPDVERGKYLVNFGSCNDCHTPMVMGPNGPGPDTTRLLSGHPQDMLMPPAPTLEGPWMAAASSTLTAWSGPWGVSFTANLTPDKETGLGKWTAEDFIATIRNGRHMGRGRPLLPPMPYQYVSTLTDADLRNVFAYLQSLPAISNRVPEPIAPAAQR
jgi:hypothetical protein